MNTVPQLQKKRLMAYDVETQQVRSAKAARGGARRWRNSTDLAAESESVLYEFLGKQLREARRDIEASMRLREEARIEPAADTMDEVQAAGAREFVVLNLDRSTRHLRQID